MFNSCFPARIIENLTRWEKYHANKSNDNMILEETSRIMWKDTSNWQTGKLSNYSKWKSLLGCSRIQERKS